MKRQPRRAAQVREVRRMKRNQSGETIVEVLVSAMLFLLLMAVLQAAVMFSGAAQRKSGQLRGQYSDIIRKLPETELKPNDAPDGVSGTYTFQAYDIDETTAGSNVFRMEVGLGHKDVPYQNDAGDDKVMRFSLFCGGEE